jgi:hypothetical protein
VVHACNPSYSGGRDQEDCSSKPTRANSSQDLKKDPSQKRTGGVAEGVEPEFKTWYWKKKKQKTPLYWAGVQLNGEACT